MVDPGFEFVKGAVGTVGAAALEKAVARIPALATALVPRVLVSWLTVHEGGYSGPVPGQEQSHLTLTKSEGSYSGLLKIGDGVHIFDEEPLLKVAAGLAVALGADRAIDPTLRKGEVSKLGRSVDRLVVANSLSKTAEKPGPAAVPVAPGAPISQEPPVPVQRRKPITKGEVKVSKEELGKMCPACRKREFDPEGEFTGCSCLKKVAAAGDWTVQKSEDILTFTFGPSWTHDAIGTFLVAIKGTV